MLDSSLELFLSIKIVVLQIEDIIHRQLITVSLKETFNFSWVYCFCHWCWSN